VKYLLENYTYENENENMYSTLVMYSVCSGKTEILKLLIKYKIKKEQNIEKLLTLINNAEMISTISGDKEIKEYLTNIYATIESVNNKKNI